MKDYHPSPDLLKRFLDGTLDPDSEPDTAAERRRVVRHLLTGCPACQKVTRELVQGQTEVLRIVDWEA
jgi:anti-sigma factor RsiW